MERDCWWVWDFFFGGVGNVMKLNILKAIEFYTLKGGILWNVNYFLMKHF